MIRKGVVLLVACLMAVSMFAPFVAGTPTTTQAATTDDPTGVSLGQTERIDPAPVDRALEDANGTVEVVVRAEEFEVPGATTASTDSVVEDLQDHAEESQQPILDYAASTDGVEVLNRFWLANAVLLELDADRVDVAELAAQDGVTSVHANFEVNVPEPADVNASAAETTYGLDQVNATEAWSAYGTMGAGAKVAVLDTGVDVSHPDIELYTENASDPTYPGGWAEFNGSGGIVEGSEPHDTDAHGTHTSGTVAGGNASGEYVGVAPNVDLLHGLVLPGGSGGFAQIIAGMEWAVEEDADVVSMSLGTEDFSPQLIEPVRNAEDAGTVVVASSGNCNEGCSGSPGNVYDSVAVGASNADAGIAGFSSGETVDTASAWGDDAPADWPAEYVVPDVAAPGVSVKSAEPGGGYQQLSGTSMAAPHVAGTMALLVAASGGTAGPAELRAAVEETAWKPSGEPDGQDTRYGHGIVDAAAAAGQVAVDTGVAGTVTEAGSGDAVPGVAVESDDGFRSTTGADGRYDLRLAPGNHTLTADAFGYSAETATVAVPADGTADRNFSLAPEFAVETTADQPDEILGGDSLSAELRVAHADELVVEQVGDFDASDATLLVDGSEHEFGESVVLDDRYGTVTVTVETADGSSGAVELRHTVSGLNDSVEVTTGPTTVHAEGDQVGVVATPGDGGAEAFADTITEQSVTFQTTVITPEEAVEDPDEFDVLVAHSLGSSLDQLDTARQLLDATTEHQVGLVVLDQQGGGADAITRLSEARGYPAVVDYPTSFVYGIPDWYADVDDADHPLWDGVQFDNVTTAPPDFERTDLPSPEYTTVHWGGFDGDVEALAGQVFLPSAPSIGTDDPRGVTLFGSLGYAGGVGPGDYTDNTLTALVNAIDQRLDVTDDTAVSLTAETADRVDPGQSIGATFDVADVDAVRTEVTDATTVPVDDLTLTHGSTDATFGEYTDFDAPVTDDEFTVAVGTAADATGVVELEHTFVVQRDDGTTGNVTVTTRRTSVYEPPLEVPTDADSVDEAVGMAVPNEEIVLEDGTYEEQVVVPYDRPVYNLTIRGEAGATPTIEAPDDLGPDEAVVEIQAMHTTVENLRIEGHHTEENRLYGIVSGVTGGEVETHYTTVRDVSIDGVDIGVQFGGLLIGSDSRHGHVDNVSVTDAHIGIIAGTPPDETFITDASDALIENSYVEDAEMGIVADSRQTEDTVIRNNTVVDTERAIAQDGANGLDAVDNEIHNASVGIYNVRGQISRYEGNVITDAEVGVDLRGDRFGGYRRNEITRNTIEADTGVRMNGFGWLSSLPIPVWVHYNDFEHTDVAIESTREREARANVDARLNWYGEDGEATVVHNASENEVVHDPFLVERPGDVDQDDPRAFGTALDLEAGESTTVGLPGPVAGTVSDAFGDDFAGAVYGYDADAQSWEMLSGDDSLDALQGLYVTASEDTQATLSFYHGEDAESTPAAAGVSEGWNFLAAPELAGAEDAYANASVELALQPGRFARPDSGLTHETGELDGAHVFGSNDTAPQVSPFEGTFLYAEEDGSLPARVSKNPSLDGLYAGLNVSSRVEEPILGTGAGAADLDAATLGGERARQQVQAAALAAAVDFEPRSEHELDELAAVVENAAHRAAFATDLSEAEVDGIVRDVLERVLGDDPAAVAAERGYSPIPFDGIEEYAVDADGSGDGSAAGASSAGADAADADATDSATTADATDRATAADGDAAYQVAFVDGMDPLWNAGDRMVEELHDRADVNGSFNVTPVHATAFFDDLNASLETYDVVVVNNLGTVREDVDDAKIEQFVAYAERPDLGVVYLGNKDDDPPNAVHEISDLRGDPASVGDESDFGADEVFYEVADEHPLFDGLAAPGERVQVLDDPWSARYSWFGGYDGDTVASLGTDEEAPIGGGVGVDGVRNEVLLSASAFNGFVIEWDFSDDALQLLANAIETVEPFEPVMVAENAPVHAEPGTAIEADLTVSRMESVTVELADGSTLAAEDLTLSVGGEELAFGEERSFDPPTSAESYPVSVETDGGVAGRVVLNVTVQSEFTDGPVTLTVGPTAVYDPPLTAGEDVPTVQEAVDLAPDDGRVVHVADGTYEEQVTVTTPNVTLRAADGADPTVAPTDGTAITVAADDVTVSGLNVTVAGDHDGVVVDGVANATVSGVGVHDAATGVALVNATAANVTDASATDVGTGVSVTGAATRASVTDVTVAGGTGVSLAGVDRDEVTVRFNDLSATEVGVDSDLDRTFDARLNYLGHGTADTAIEGDVAYEPFLTEPPARVDHEEPTAIGVELLVEAGESTAVGVPGPTNLTAGELFEDDFEGTIYDYDAGPDKPWTEMDDDEELGTLEGLRVDAETDGHAVVEFRGTGPSAPGTVELEQGWNFVAAPTYADAETAFQVGSADVWKVRDKFAAPAGQPGPAASFDGSYVFGSGKETPDVSAFQGYFVHVEQGGEGTVPSYLHSEVTMADLYELVGLDAGEFTDDEDAETDEDDRSNVAAPAGVATARFATAATAG